MKSNLKIFLPIIIIFLIFLVDKLILLKPIQDCCIKDEFGYIFREFDINFFINKSKEIKSNNKKLALVFGSSLSYGFFYSNSKEFKETIPGCGENKNCFYKDWEILNLSIPGASILSHYIHLTQILENGIKPDLILIELAPNSFNSESPWYNYEILESFNIDFILSHYIEIPFAHFKKVLFSRIFTLSRFKFGNKNNNQDLIKHYFQQFVFNYSNKNQSQISVPKSYQVGEYNPTQTIMNDFFLSVLMKTFSGYIINQDLELYLNLIEKKIKFHSIRTIFWFPSISPAGSDVVKKIQDGKEWTGFLERNRGLDFINLNENKKITCGKYLDVFHMGVECYSMFFNYIQDLK